MNRKTIFVLGEIFGRLCAAIDPKKVNRTAFFESNNHPLNAVTLAHQQALKSGKITKSVEDYISVRFNEINIDDLECSIPDDDFKGTFQLAYFKGLIRNISFFLRIP